MTELVFKVDDELAEMFKKISLQKFDGDETIAFEYALKSLISDEGKNLVRLEKIVEQLQEEIERSGGVTEKKIDEYIAAYRREKRAQGAKI